MGREVERYFAAVKSSAGADCTDEEVGEESHCLEVADDLAQAGHRPATQSERQ